MAEHSRRPDRKHLAAGVLALVLGVSGCARTSEAVDASTRTVVWHTLGSWTGRDSMQTTSFLFQSGAMRVRWRATGTGTDGEGTLRLALHSAVSGRELKVITDQHGAGAGESYIAETPRAAYVLVDAGNMDWSFVVEEAFVGTSR